MVRRTKQLENRLDQLEKSVGRLWRQTEKDSEHRGAERPKLGDLHGHLQRLEKQVKALRKH